MRHLFIAIVTPAVLLASGAFPDLAGAADVTPPPPGYGPPPPVMIGHRTMERHRTRTGHPRPPMNCPPAIDRQSTTARHLSTARHDAHTSDRRTQFRMPLRRRTPRVVFSGDAAPGVADGGASVTRKSTLGPTAVMYCRHFQEITVRIEV
jgi:hypothetical protein